ncbi:MAG: hypothetical protein IKP68_04475 [Clostridia bacterium]|nr:hypothetical protein [Clostridia bacterium]
MLKWLENFWYHHKWATIITVFFLVVAVICFAQLFGRKNYDAYFEFIGNGGAITKTQYEDIVSSLKGFVADSDENGEVSVLFSREAFVSDESDPIAGTINSNVTSFMQSALYQDYFIFFIDPKLYESYKDSGMFVSLVGRVENIPDEMKYDECALKLSEMKIYELPGMNAMPGDTLVVLKTVPYFSSGKKAEFMQEIQNIHKGIIERFVAYGVYGAEE